jgi:hypothetical protein
MDLALPDDLQAFATAESKRRGYENPSVFMQALLEAEKHRQLRLELESLLLDAADGPFSEWTNQDLSDIRRVGAQMINQRKPR